MSYILDDHEYQTKDAMPDLGSLVCTSKDGRIRNYEGLSADVSKLPKYADLSTGSSFLACDNGDFYKYEATTKTWYKV